MGIPALSQYVQKAVPLTQKSVAAAGIGASYTLVDSIFSNGIVWLCLISTLDAAVQLSLDGVNDFIAMPIGNTVPSIIQIPFKDFDTALSGHFGIYVKEIGNPTTGSLFISAITI